jgi:hypothetical protein
VAEIALNQKAVMHFSGIIVLNVHVRVEEKTDDTKDICEDIQLSYSSNSIIDATLMQNLVASCQFENVLSAILALKFSNRIFILRELTEYIFFLLENILCIIIFVLS